MNAPQNYRTRLIGGFLIVTLLAVSLIWGIAQRPSISAAGQTFRIAGASMAPALRNESFQFDCQECSASVTFGLVEPEQSVSQIVCSICGHHHDWTALLAQDRVTRVNGDLVTLTPTQGAINRGDLVAIRTASGRLQVKRVVAKPNEVVDQKSGRLLVDGSRIEDLLHQESVFPSRILIDDTALTSPARWHDETVDGAIWKVYQHTNVHDPRIPASAVLNDYQCNAGVSRQLAMVDRLAVDISLKAQLPDRDEIEIAFWTESESRLGEVSLDSSVHFDTSVYDASPTSGLPVSKESPIAIRVGRAVDFERIRVFRFIEYRLRDSDDRNVYPIRLGKREFFVLGDNVPVSVDSRTVGPIARKDIVGTITRKEGEN